MGNQRLFRLRPRLAAHEGKPCPYCKRTMTRFDFRLQPTRDHHPTPRSKGGKTTIICCHQCNSLKGDMDAFDWRAFMAATPGWWMLTRGERRALNRARRGVLQPKQPGDGIDREAECREAEQFVDAEQVPVERELADQFHRVVSFGSSGGDPTGESFKGRLK